MSKHLLYLGYTGKAHRVALFDTGKVIAKSIPIKDVPVLSDDLEFLNCTVKDGVPYPNLHGAKVVCSVPDVKDNKARFTVYDTRNSYDGKKAAMNLVDFYAFKSESRSTIMAGRVMARDCVMQAFSDIFTSWISGMALVMIRQCFIWASLQY